MLLVISVVAALLVVAVLLVIVLLRGRLEIPPRSRQRILPGGGAVPADLSKDASTDDQRFLM
jgi:hypothetical protein